MSVSNINNVITVIPVRQQNTAVEWYRNLLDRDADVVPAEGVAEWRLAENAWLQVTTDKERAGSTTIIIGVNDIDAQCSACTAVNISHSEITEYPGIIKMFEVIDPDGNKVAFVQDISTDS